MIAMMVYSYNNCDIELFRFIIYNYNSFNPQEIFRAETIQTEIEIFNQSGCFKGTVTNWGVTLLKCIFHGVCKT